MNVEIGGFYENRSGAMLRKLVGIYQHPDGHLMVHWQDRFGAGHCQLAVMRKWAVKQVPRPRDWQDGVALTHAVGVAANVLALMPIA